MLQIGMDDKMYMYSGIAEHRKAIKYSADNFLPKLCQKLKVGKQIRYINIRCCKLFVFFN